MIAKIVGISNKEFTINDQNFKGQELYFTCRGKNVEGLQTGKVFANNGDYHLGDEVNLLYSKTFKKLYIKK